MTQPTVMSQKDLSDAFDLVSEELLNVLLAFDQQQINTIPFTGGWTAAQVGEHLFKSDSGVLRSLYGPVKETERAPDEHVDIINSQFLDFSTKLKSPDFILPADIEHDKEILISALKSTRELLAKAIRSLDLSMTCTEPQMAAIVGEWTRQEFVTFVIAHTQRHIHQLKQIFKRIE